jgi:DnaK suppressor protein
MMANIKKFVKKPAAKKIVAKKPAPKKTPSQKTVVKKPVAKKIVKTVPKKTAAKKPAPKKAIVKKTIVKKAPAKKTAPSKIVSKKPVPKKTIVKKSPAKKTAPSKIISKKPAPKKTIVKAPSKIASKKPEPKKETIKSIQASVNLVAPKTKKIPPIQTHTMLKTNLFELMPEYEASEEEIKQDYMDEKNKARFHTLLNSWRQELMLEVDRTVEHMKDDTGNFADPADRATQEEGFSLELRARDRERNLIKKIEEALRRVDEGDYGYCEACGVEIGYKRLEARPTATLCIDCKTVDEIRERQLAS